MSRKSLIIMGLILMSASLTVFADIKVTQITGKAFIKYPDAKTFVPLTLNTTIKPLSKIKTEANSFVRLIFDDNVRLLIKPLSEVEIQTFSVLIKNGRSFIRLIRQATGFKAYTPIGVATVRGTFFVVDYTSNTMTVVVLENSVEVASNNGNSVIVNEGYYTTVKENQAPATPVKADFNILDAINSDKPLLTSTDQNSSSNEPSSASTNPQTPQKAKEILDQATEYEAEATQLLADINTFYEQGETDSVAEYYERLKEVYILASQLEDALLSINPDSTDLAKLKTILTNIESMRRSAEEINRKVYDMTKESTEITSSLTELSDALSENLRDASNIKSDIEMDYDTANSLEDYAILKIELENLDNVGKSADKNYQKLQEIISRISILNQEDNLKYNEAVSKYNQVKSHINFSKRSEVETSIQNFETKLNIIFESDDDNDGYTFYQEIKAGTDPNDKNSHP